MGHVKFPVAVHLFLERGNETLLLRRFNTGYEDGNYSVIAGHLDGGEDVYTAMAREAREEAGITISRGDLRVVQVMHRKKSDEERIDYFFACDKWGGEIENKEPHKCDELKWFDIGKMPPNTVDYVEAAFKNFKEGEAFTLFGW